MTTYKKIISQKSAEWAITNYYKVGVVLGCSLGIILSLVGLFCIIKQNDDIQGQVLELRAKVAEHEEVIKQYEFYVWHNMKFFDEKELKE